MNTPVSPFTTSAFENSGSGRIVASQDVSKPCVWKYSQRSDGRIEVHCQLSPTDLRTLQSAAREANESFKDDWFEEHSLQFEGQTSDGKSLHLETVDFVISPEEGELVFHVAQAQWLSASAPAPSHMIFRLVNHEISAVPSSSVMLPSGLTLNGTFIPLKLPFGNAWLREVDDQYEIIKQLEQKGGVAVTTEFLLPITNYEQEAEGVEIAHQLCCVLTLLSGNRVNWISYSIIAANSSTVSGNAQNAVTRTYQKTDLINTLSDSRTHLGLTGTACSPIINRMMERFESQHDKWNLTSVINSFHEAVSSGHFLEQQGQLLSNCMEMLRQSFLNHGGNEFVLSQPEFEARYNALRRAVKKALEEQFPDKEDWTLEECTAHGAKLTLISTHLRGANRYGFKHSLTEISNELGLFAQSVCEFINPPDARGFIAPLRLDSTKEEDEAISTDAAANLKASINAFVDIRDYLTHQGRFLVPTVDEKANWTRQRVNEERMQQERFMERFVAAHLAAILGWHQPLPTPPRLYHD